MTIFAFAIVGDSESNAMSDAPNTAIGKYILRVMEEEGWSPSDVLENAKVLKVKLKQSTFSEIYSGETKDPQVSTLVKISKALKRPFEEMAAEIEGTPATKTTQFRDSDFALIAQTYDKLKDKRIADEFVEMLKEKLSELLKRQGETNLLHLRK